MTDFELVTIFVEFVNTAWIIFGTFVSIVFAFIVASHLAARQLSSRLVSLVITLYTLVAFWSIWGISMQVSSISAVAGEMRRRLNEGNSSLEWLPVLGMSDSMSTLVPYLITLLVVVVYLGSLVFFFYQRREMNRDIATG